MTPTAVWWHCFSGFAGDMALGSLIDAGADADEVRAILGGLHLPGWRLETAAVTRGGLSATHARVHADEALGTERPYAAVAELVGAAALPERVRGRALAVFARLAEAEGRIHGVPASEVHFHEVGGIDAIVDVVGTAAALEVLGVDEVHASAVAQGSGTIRSAHGLLPNPSPAVLDLLRGAPVHGVGRAQELTTPTGAALLAALVVGWGPMPPMRVTAVGRGAGSADPDGVPNVVQVALGSAGGDGPADGGQPVTVLETNLDDVTGETLGHLIGALMAAGAHDAWVTPILGKKGRPAQMVSVVADPATAGALRSLLVAETGTLGVRGRTLTRWTAARTTTTVEVDGHRVSVKVSGVRRKAEHDDVVRVARVTGLTVHEVAARAEWAARSAPTGD